MDREKCVKEQLSSHLSPDHKLSRRSETGMLVRKQKGVETTPSDHDMV